MTDTQIALVTARIIQNLDLDIANANSDATARGLKTMTGVVPVHPQKNTQTRTVDRGLVTWVFFCVRVLFSKRSKRPLFCRLSCVGL